MVVVSGRTRIGDRYIRRLLLIEVVAVVSRILGKDNSRIDQFLIRVPTDSHGIVAPVRQTNLRWEHGWCTLAVARGCSDSSLGD